STVEMRDEASRPPLQNHDAPVKDYDVIFVGFPIWWLRDFFNPGFFLSF
ncbi:MAG: hypothetical protein II119_01350, partial [Bacilli bacterium]|nr:hypothetical protein [Bacilli bacterium]